MIWCSLYTQGLFFILQRSTVFQARIFRGKHRCDGMEVMDGEMVEMVRLDLCFTEVEMKSS